MKTLNKFFHFIHSEMWQYVINNLLRSEDYFDTQMFLVFKGLVSSLQF